MEYFLTAWVVLVPLILALVAAPAAALAGTFRPSLSAPVGAVLAALAAGATLYVWLSGGGEVNFAWAPTLDLRFAVKMDGLAALYSLLATGVGFAVLVYSRRYLPLHLEHEGRPETAAPRFYFFMLLFMGSMVGLAMSQDLILLFVFWDLTAIASYYLIGYDEHKEESRYSALMALLITGITAVLLLIGALMFYAAYGTFSIPRLADLTETGHLLTTAGAFIAVAGLAKSAQVPLHFWLPRAMAAPTPVSAYLHSAAMVAAGVLLIGRVYPLLQKSDALLTGFLVVGTASIAVGGILALTRDVLKQLLAYSTISQYGYVVFMFGLGGKYGAAGASLYVIAHALSKSALFLTAGAVTEATGEDKLSRLGGLARQMPVLAVSGGVAAAGLAAFPLTIGFFKDELLFAAALERGPIFVGISLFAAVLTLAYTWRFWGGIFLGETVTEARKLPVALVAPVAGLGLFVLAGGVFIDPFAELARAAGAVSYAASVESVEPAYHLDARPENLLALATFGLGVLLIISRQVWTGAAGLFAKAGQKLGPERIYAVSLEGLNKLSDRAHTAEVRDLRGRIIAILIPAGILVGLGVVVTPIGGVYKVGEITVRDLPLLLALLSAAIAALATCLTVKHVTLALVISSAGFSIAGAFAFFGAPDVALVAVLIETFLTLLIFGTMRLIPAETLRAGSDGPKVGAWRKAAVATVAAAFVMAVVWGTLSQPFPEKGVVSRLIKLTPEAHAKDVVTVILADFRGLDTLGEITVVALILLAVATLLGRGRP
ncbi:MAG: hydrogen gas-evolving membrane-bound hydrogenase subunit E [Rubrobacteraceae bacterium]